MGGGKVRRGALGGSQGLPRLKKTDEEFVAGHEERSEAWNLVRKITLKKKEEKKRTEPLGKKNDNAKYKKKLKRNNK